MRLYANPISVFSNKAHYVLEYINEPFDYINLDLSKGDARTDQHKAMHPAGKVPVLEDGEFILFESDAIVRYLCEKFDSPLIPQDLKTKALVDQWNQFISSHVSNALLKIFFNRVIAPRRNFPIDETALKDGARFLKRDLPILNKQLEQTGFLLGDAITYADLNLLAITEKMPALEIDLTPFENITAFIDKLQRLPFYQNAMKRHQTTLP